ncbi:MAG: aminoglycoside phosphotransferase family protein [Anaerolineae bacterium]|nr:aminoglycoside phosphotransferase family protein [Anaerolineae bacterium]
MNTLLMDSPTILLAPPIIPKDNQARDWFPLPTSDPITDHITASFLDEEVAPDNWQVARLSRSAYVYRERATSWKVVTKFHALKTGKDAIHHAEREYRLTQQAWKRLGSDRENRSVQPLGLWDGALFLEFVEGLTLEDKIAIRRSQPGELRRVLEAAAVFLANLHESSSKPKSTSDFGQAADYAYKLVDNLAKYGVLKNYPNVQNGIGNLIEKWTTDPLMWDYQATQIHGDATSSNFIFPPEGGVVAIDWERSEKTDAAADLGRLMAEVTHGVNQHGGDFAEGNIFANYLATSYCNELHSHWERESLLYRARFYQATSTLRIARNGWLSRQDRLALVLQAFALLSK